jgi:tetratricopeptide (TPR) repeat protein
VLISAAISILAMSAVFIVYFAGIDRGSLFFLEVYFIPWYIALGVLAALGTAVLFGLGSLHSPDLPTARYALAALLILGLALVGGAVNRRVCDMSDNLAGYVYSHDVLATVTSSEDRAILVTGGDEIFLFWYWQWVEGEGKDVVCIGMDALSVQRSWFWDDLARAHPGLVLPDFEELAARYSGDELRWRTLDSLVRANADTHRCWMTAWDPAFDPLIHQEPWHMVLDGPALELERDREGRMVDYPRASIPASEYLFRALLDLDRAGLEPFEREVYDRYAAACYNLALYFWRNDEPAQAAEFAKLCLLFRPGYSAGENTYKPEELLAFNLLEAGDLSLAQTTLGDLIQEDPNNSLYHAYLGEVFIAQGDFEAARRELELALRLEPDNQFILERYREVFQQGEEDGGDGE